MRHTIQSPTRFASILALTLLLTMATGTVTHAQAQKKGKTKAGPAEKKAGATAMGDLSIIGPYHLTLKEYEAQFLKNNGGVTAARNSTPAERREFLDLLIEYRLKVLEARAKGYDKDSAIVAELRDYRNNLAVPYLQERALVDPNIEVLYKRRNTEVRVAHIVISITNDSTGAPDTVTAYTRAMDLIAQLRQGARFDSLAQAYSADANTAKLGGDLGFFTAGMTAPGFDEAVYSLQVGQVAPLPQRTPFGYHVVKLLDKIPTRELEISHILCRFNPENAADTSAAWTKITSILDTLKKGGDFKELAMRNSEDPYSGGKGGDLGFSRRRRYVPEFEEVAFTLKPGEYTMHPVRTGFGYHIIKVTADRPPASFEESKNDMKDIYRKYALDEDKKAFTASIMKKHDVKTIEATIEQLASVLDTTSTTSVNGWQTKIPASVLALPFIQLKNRTVTVDDAVKTILRNRDFSSKPLTRASLATMAGILAEKEVWQDETADLETRYPEFGALMTEYQEGVLLFRAEQEEVWDKVEVKDDALRAFWEQHKDDYSWADRVRFTEIFVTNDSIAGVVMDSLRLGIDFARLAEEYTQRSGYKEKKGDWGLQAKETNDLTKKAWTLQVGQVEGPMKFQYGISIIKVTEKEGARVKTFDEAKSEASSKFQDFESKRIKNEWVSRLKAKYGVKTNDTLLDQAFKNLK